MHAGQQLAVSYAISLVEACKKASLLLEGITAAYARYRWPGMHT